MTRFVTSHSVILLGTSNGSQSELILPPKGVFCVSLTYPGIVFAEINDDIMSRSPSTNGHNSSARTTNLIRNDSVASSAASHAYDDHGPNFKALEFVRDDSDVYRAHVNMDHYNHRGSYWNSRKHEVLMRYIHTALVG
eukprot:scaffold26496_cov113-Cylindrotheca_fusiformis.AAC.1